MQAVPRLKEEKLIMLQRNKNIGTCGYKFDLFEGGSGRHSAWDAELRRLSAELTHPRWWPLNTEWRKTGAVKGALSIKTLLFLYLRHPHQCTWTMLFSPHHRGNISKVMIPTTFQFQPLLMSERTNCYFSHAYSLKLSIIYKPRPKLTHIHA